MAEIEVDPVEPMTDERFEETAAQLARDPRNAAYAELVVEARRARREEARIRAEVERISDRLVFDPQRCELADELRAVLIDPELLRDLGIAPAPTAD